MMFDLHCHMLPGLDDGPDTLTEALQLARQAVADGITHAVLTPHIHDGRWDNSRAQIAAHLQAFRGELARAAIPLQIAAAAEVRIGTAILTLVPAGQIPFLGRWQGMDVLLLEMPHSHILPGTEKIIEWLLARNIIPMIAHPERNKDVMRKPAKLRPLVELGCLFQVTAGAITGQFGAVAMARAVALLEQGVVTIMATDAHHSSRRPAILSEGCAAAAAIIGAEAARQLVYTNPRTIAAGLFEPQAMT